MTTVPCLARILQEILGEKANQLAVETGFMQRERVLSGSSFMTGLVFGWQANPQASLENLSQSIGNAGTPISRQGLAQRFDQEAVIFVKSVLEASLEVMVRGMPVAQGILKRFSSVDLVDSSIITLPNRLQDVWQGSGGFGENARVSSLKLNVRLDVRSGQLKTLELSDGTQPDRSSAAHQQAVSAGSLQIEDLGYFKLGDFETIGEQQAYWLSRYKLGTRVCNSSGECLDLVAWLPQQIGDRLEGDILLGNTARLPCRLVAERVPAWVVDQRHARLQEEARQNQTMVSPRALTMAQWTIYVTNLPARLASTQEVFLLGRYRWQIELLFKLWKSDLQIDQWASQKPERILCEIYTKLIGAILTHWFLLVACWHNSRHSFRLAMPTIRGLAWQFANSLASLNLLQHAFTCLCRALAKSNMGKSHADPRAWQLIGAAVP